MEKGTNFIVLPLHKMTGESKKMKQIQFKQQRRSQSFVHATLFHNFYLLRCIIIYSTHNARTKNPSPISEAQISVTIASIAVHEQVNWREQNFFSPFSLKCHQLRRFSWRSSITVSFSEMPSRTSLSESV
jgi:hypothetical protein